MLPRLSYAGFMLLSLVVFVGVRHFVPRPAELRRLPWQKRLVLGLSAFIGGALDGGWPAVMDRNHGLALRGREVLAAALGLSASLPAPESMLGAMIALPMPPSGPLAVSGLERGAGCHDLRGQPGGREHGRHPTR